jgi:hypothetical protein
MSVVRRSPERREGRRKERRKNFVPLEGRNRGRVSKSE